MRNRIVIITVLVISLLLSSCSSDSRIDELEQRVEVLENAVGITENNGEEENATAEGSTSVLSEENRKSKSITLIKDFNNKEETCDGGFCQLYLHDDRCTLLSNGPDNIELTCDFSTDVYEEVLDMICSQNLEAYESITDENGKIVDETVPYVLSLNSGYVKAPSNIDEIVSRFESLKEQAEPTQ